LFSTCQYHLIPHCEHIPKTETAATAAASATAAAAETAPVPRFRELLVWEPSMRLTASDAVKVGAACYLEAFFPYMPASKELNILESTCGNIQPLSFNQPYSRLSLAAIFIAHRSELPRWYRGLWGNLSCPRTDMGVFESAGSVWPLDDGALGCD